jgi:serine/threonine protein phosphatase PrpC
VEEAMGCAFTQLAERLSGDEQGRYGWVGTTATLALLPEGGATGVTVMVANVGDSAAVLLDHRSNAATLVSEWHRPAERKEEERICGSGGFVSAEGELNGMLGVSRTLGDSDHPPPHCSVPFVKAYALPSASFSLILASDGLWDVVAPEAVGGVLSGLPPVGRTPAGEAATLRDEAFLRGSADNITVAVVSAAPSAIW